MSTPDLRTTVGELALRDPVLVAAGCAGTGRELEPFLDLGDLAALVTRSVTPDPRAEGAPPRTVETPGGLLSDAGPGGAGLHGFLAAELPWLAQRRVRTIVSVAGDNLGEWAELARRVGISPGVGGVEVNLSWSGGDRPAPARDAYQAQKVVAAVRRDMPRGVPVLAKIAADPHTVVDVTRAVVRAGAAAVVVGGGLPGLSLDAATLRPAVSGTLGGPAVLPVTLSCIWLVHAALPEVAVVGCGGVRTGADALAMIAVGARAVQVGSTLLADPGAPRRIVAELTEELRRRGEPTVWSLVGRAHREASLDPLPSPT
jgi:dihydroorotate dehydrogenase (NAD+) catalytic subunit